MSQENVELVRAVCIPWEAGEPPRDEERGNPTVHAARTERHDRERRLPPRRLTAACSTRCEFVGTASGRRVTTGSDGQTAAAARAIIDEIAFMTLATVDADGIPWASPVWFAHANHANFFWISRPETRHSQNIASNPRIAIVIFDSRTPIDTGRGVYLEAEANEVVDDAEVERIMAIFSERSVAQGGSAWTAAEVRASGRPAALPRDRPQGVPRRQRPPDRGATVALAAGQSPLELGTASMASKRAEAHRYSRLDPHPLTPEAQVGRWVRMGACGGWQAPPHGGASRSLPAVRLLRSSADRSAAHPIAHVEHPVALDHLVGILQQVLCVDRPEVALAGAEHHGRDVHG